MKIRPKHPLAIRWFHWINFPVIFLMIWSGFLIYWANDEYAIKWNGKEAFHFFPDSFFAYFNMKFKLSQGMAWHFAFMWIFTINGILYVAYTLFSGEWRYLLPGKKSLKEAWQVLLHDLYISKKPLPHKKFNGAQQIAYTTVVIMGIGSLVTGLAIYKPVQLHGLTWLMGGYETARLIHFILTIGYCLFFTIHIIQVVKSGWNHFRAMITGFEVVKEKQKKQESAHEDIS